MISVANLDYFLAFLNQLTNNQIVLDSEKLRQVPISLKIQKSTNFWVISNNFYLNIFKDNKGQRQGLRLFHDFL